MTNRTMFDGENLATVPRTGASMIAYYVDLYGADEVQALFPDWSKIPIQRSLNYNPRARVFDVETGAISPTSNLEAIITEYNEKSPYYKGGGRPIVYCDRSNISDVREYTGKYILGKNYYIWVATLDGTVATAASLGLPENSVVACQDHEYDGYDSSVVFSSQWVPN